MTSSSAESGAFLVKRRISPRNFVFLIISSELTVKIWFAVECYLGSKCYTLNSINSVQQTFTNHLLYGQSQELNIRRYNQSVLKGLRIVCKGNWTRDTNV